MGRHAPDACRRIKRPLAFQCLHHGDPKAFRDWASERTNFAREICEAALAHIVKDSSDVLFNRGA
jgi:hypothetical protein